MNVYAGSPGFRLQVDGTPFTPVMKIYFDGVEMATNYVNPNKLSTEISANMIAQPGQRTIAVQTRWSPLLEYDRAECQSAAQADGAIYRG
jgi:hypothetical protein